MGQCWLPFPPPQFTFCPEPSSQPFPTPAPQSLGVPRSGPLAVCPQVRYLQRPITLWCGLNHSLVLSQSSEFSKELLGCGCGAGGRLPGWPKGSASFVKLQVKVRAGSGEGAPREDESHEPGSPQGCSWGSCRDPGGPISLASPHLPPLPHTTLSALSLSRLCWPCPTSLTPGT